MILKVDKNTASVVLTPKVSETASLSRASAADNFSNYSAGIAEENLSARASTEESDWFADSARAAEENLRLIPNRETTEAVAERANETKDKELVRLCKNTDYAEIQKIGQPLQTRPGRNSSGKLCQPCGEVDKPTSLTGHFQFDCKYVFSSLPQDTSDDSSSSPPTIRRRSTSSPALGDQFRDSTETQNINNKDRMVGGLHRKFCGWSFVSIKRDTRSHISWIRFGTSMKSGIGKAQLLPITSRKTEIAKDAGGPRLQGLLAEDALAKAVLRAEKFGDLITADHKVFNEEGESRNNHRCSVVVQDLATQWIQSYPCKTKETERSLRKFLEPSHKPKVIYIDNSLEFGKACEESSWNHCTSTRHAELKKELLQYCCNLASTKNCGLIPWNVSLIFDTSKTSYRTGQHYERRFGEPLRGQ